MFQDIDGGIFSLLQSSTNSFPLDFNPLLKLLTPLASEGSRQVGRDKICLSNLLFLKCRNSINKLLWLEGEIYGIK